jgi:hypothetical protein
MAPQEDSEGIALVRNKWMTMLGLIHYVLVNQKFFAVNSRKRNSFGQNNH